MLILFGATPIWVATRLMRVKSAGFISCIVSFGATASITYLVKEFVTPAVIPSALLSIPIVGIANAFIFSTTVVKGAVISLLSGLLLAVVVIFLGAA